MENTKQEPKDSALGLYCHVPFCSHRCAYCAFYQERPTLQLIEKYLAAIEGEISLLGTEIQFNTVYVGGGTPGVLTAGGMERLCASLLKNRKKENLGEFSVEFSPQTVSREKVEVLKNYGCNRITMGVQSFNQKTMEVLEHRQNSKQVFTAYETISSCAVENIGIDLIFSIPGQTMGEWLSDLECAVNLGAKHISTYNLTFEGGTTIGEKLLNKTIRKKSEEEEATFCLETWKFLEERGYFQYEISNFCLPGFESLHNVNVWEMRDWIGVGPSACSQYKNFRFSNPPSTSQWAERVEGGNFAHENVEKISEQTLGEDSLIFGLRMNMGINIASLGVKFGSVDFSKFETLFSALEGQGLVKISGNIAKLTDRGRLLADSIAVEILAA